MNADILNYLKIKLISFFITIFELTFFGELQCINGNIRSAQTRDLINIELDSLSRSSQLGIIPYRPLKFN